MDHSYHSFSLSHYDANTEVLASYEITFVVISILIAVGASLVSFSLSARTAKADFKNERVFWSIASSCFLGFGIWAMHFVGMLAYRLPIEVTYDPTITVLSIVPAILGSTVVIAYHPKNKKLWLNSILMGLAIGSMHYIGMMAMQMEAAMVYNGWLFLLSVVVAVVLSGISLHIHHNVMRRQLGIAKQLLPAIAMGCAIAGMHYTGMVSMHVFLFPLRCTLITLIMKTSLTSLYLW